MNEPIDSIKVIENKVIGIRILDAPRKLVSKLWSDPDQLTNWWGPRGFSTTTTVMNFRSGGERIFVMHGPDGRDYPNKILYSEIKEPELIVYKHSGDEDTEDIHFHVTVELSEFEEKTKLVMTMVFDSAEELDRVAKEFGAVEGLEQTLERLSKLVGSR